MTQLLSILILVVLIILIIVILKQQRTNDPSRLVQNVLMKEFQGANEQLVLMASQALKGKQESIDMNLANKERSFEQLVKRVLDTVELQKQQINRSDQERIGSLKQLSVELEQQRQLTSQLQTTTEGLKRILSNNQTRGQFGEQVADDLLRIAGFVNGVDYERQTAQGEGRPDFAILLPDGLRINIDVKFPYRNLQLYVESEDETDKKRHWASFRQDIRQKINDLSTREYIIAGKTVDFVILFIPNEMIFSYVYDQLNDVWAEAMEKKVVLAGPFSFTAILRLVKQAHKTFIMQENTQAIITAIKQFEKEFEKYSESFDTMGKRLQLVNDAYESLDSTRSRQLLKTIDRIKMIEGEDDTPTKLLEDA